MSEEGIKLIKERNEKRRGGEKGRERVGKG